MMRQWRRQEDGGGRPQRCDPEPNKVIARVIRILLNQIEHGDIQVIEDGGSLPAQETHRQEAQGRQEAGEQEGHEGGPRPLQIQKTRGSNLRIRSISQHDIILIMINLDMRSCFTLQNPTRYPPIHTSQVFQS